MCRTLSELVILDACVVIPAQVPPREPPGAEGLAELERLLVAGYRLTYTGQGGRRLVG
jgi:hypothetical protein